MVSVLYLMLVVTNETADLYQCVISTSALFVIMMLTITLHDISLHNDDVMILL